MRSRTKRKKTRSKRQAINDWKKKIYQSKLRYELRRKDPNPVVISLYKGDISYEDYLKSDHWRDVRDNKLKECNHSCEVCGEDGIALTIHHNNYETLGHERMEDLSCVCPYCHKDIHNKIHELQSKHFMRRMLTIVLQWKFNEPDDLK